MRSSRLVFTLISTLALATAVTACGDDGGDDDDISVVDSGTGSDAPTGIDAPTGADAPPSSSAENLALPCDEQNPCPGGEDCISLDFDGDPNTAETGGFCTVMCNGQNDTTSCSNGYTGPGQPVCAISSGAMQPPESCAVLCDVVQAPECPTGTECIDATPNDDQMNTGVCAPPPPA